MGQARSLYNPQHSYGARSENTEAQIALLEQLCTEILANAEIDHADIMEKENFRLLIEDACRVQISRYEHEVNGRRDFPALSVQLRCFGSLASGFATKSSDMDLGLLTPFSQPQPDSTESPIPRIVEKTLLEMGFGARLLSKTRVPIIKVCQKPPVNLFAGLLEERAKWERGGDEMEDEAANEEPASPIDNDSPSAISADHEAVRQTGGNPQPQNSTHDGQSNNRYRALVDGLKQGSKSLSNYYGAAKKLLRDLDSKDITNSTAASFTSEDYKTLNDVCLAFVRGLSDKVLRDRLLQYSSLSFDPTDALAPHRTIYGVMAQIEGEKMIMAWEVSSIREKDRQYDDAVRNRIQQWKILQDKAVCDVDPLTYNRELQMANDGLKKFPSIALLILEQGQYETAASYHNRTIKIMIDLGSYDSSGQASCTSVQLPHIVKHYVDGIYDHQIRSQVAEFHRSVPSPSLKAVARQHKALQLAKEFEKALEKDLYPADSVETVQRYINLLRVQLVPNPNQNSHFDYVLPMTPDTWTLVKEVRGLQDPSRMSPNQPRDQYRDKLEFPKSDIGVQCDINFSAQLALQNTHLLRCYSLTDQRVRHLVLFVKHWAKVRSINTPYRGTLSSYGYVLMVIHYLTNVARPAVCPNLQLMAPPLPPNLTPEYIENTVQCKGRDIRFWRDEQQIAHAAQRNELTQNQDPVGLLLRGFFEYYAQGHFMNVGGGHMRGFDWGRDVISIRTNGGLMSKQEKGWTGAKTVIEVRGMDKPPAAEPAMPRANPTATPGPDSSSNEPAAPSNPTPDTALGVTKSSQDRAKAEVKEVRHRYLFAIEDPFELDHNVARTVTHNGIVAIRDEFRRAWRIIKNAGRHGQLQEDLLQDVTQEKKADQSSSFWELLDEIHGNSPM